MTYQILGIGAALVDTEIRVSDEDLTTLKIEKGLMTLCDEDQQAHYIRHLREHIDSAHRACGGSAANSMIAASQLGTRVHMTCRVANDEDGHFFLGDLRKAGIEHNTNRQLVEGTTGKCLVMLTPDAERTMNTALGASNNLSPENLHPEAVQNAEYLYIEGYLATSPTGMAAAIKLRELAQQAQTKISLSLSDPGIVEHFSDNLRKMLGSKIDLIFCNEAEALSWTQTNDLEQAIETMKQDTHTFAITLGARGAICFDGQNLIQVDAPAVQAIDTNGAGDMFAGTFLAAICQGEDFSKAGSLACEGAAMVVSRMGPRLPARGYARLKEKF